MIANSIAAGPASSSRTTTTRWLRRLGLWVGLPLLFMIAAYGTLVYTFFHKFYPSVPPPHFTSPHGVSEAQRQDLEYFRTGGPRAGRAVIGGVPEVSRPLDDCTIRSGHRPYYGTCGQRPFELRARRALRDGHARLLASLSGPAELFLDDDVFPDARENARAGRHNSVHLRGLPRAARPRARLRIARVGKRSRALTRKGFRGR
jgi:hypothetical protein